jgi:hypothetical protein
MIINGKEVKSIRPMTEDEVIEYTRNRDPLLSGKSIFCIEFVDNSILLPKFDCVKCMTNDQCLFSLISEIP